MKTLKLIAEPDTHSIIMSRDFTAARDLVFKAFTDPMLIPRWWGPRYLTTTVDKMELKKGGIWRYIQHDESGNEHAFNGVYHEIVSPERIVYTFEYEGMPGHVLLETISFKEHHGITRMTDSLVCQTIEDRDGVIQSGMAEGASETWERFEEVLKSL